MKQKNLLKIIFDAVMLILFVVMYNTSATGTTFHEIGGLVLFGLFIIHIGYNYKWIVGVSKRLFQKGFSAKQRFMYCLNLLLILSFVLVGISGIMISHVLFPAAEKTAGIWLILHIVSAVCAILLVAVHLGIHWKFILGTLKKYVTVPDKIKTALTRVLVIVIMIAGVYATVMVIPVITNRLLPKTAANEMKSGNHKGMPNDINEHTPKSGETKGEQEYSNNGTNQTVEQNHSAKSHIDSVNILATVMAGLQLLSMTLMFSILTFAVEKLLSQKLKGGKLNV